MDIKEFKSFLGKKSFSNEDYDACRQEVGEFIHKTNLLKDFVEGNDLVNKIEQLEQMLIELKSLQNIIEPYIYTTVFTERTGEKAILGKANILFKDGSKKMISVYIGKESKFTSKEDPIAFEIARQKIRDKVRSLG